MECAGMGFGGMLEIWVCIRVFLCGIKNTTNHLELSRKNRLHGRQRGKHRAHCDQCGIFLCCFTMHTQTPQGTSASRTLSKDHFVPASVGLESAYPRVLGFFLF